MMRAHMWILLVAIAFSTSTAEEKTPVGKELFHRKWTHDEDALKEHLKEIRKRDSETQQMKAAAEGAKGPRRTRLRQQLARNQRQQSRKVQIVQKDNAKSDGLGPLHNATSCADCHNNGGGSDVDRNATMITVDPRSDAVTKVNEEHGQQLFELFPSLLTESGRLRLSTVVHDRSTSDGYAAIRNRLAGYVPDGVANEWFLPQKRTSKAIASRPIVAGRHENVDFYLSQRNSPALFGIGWLDQIDTRTRRNLAAKQAKKSNGEITGQVAGKFGWRGQINSVDEFVAQACANELGLTIADRGGDDLDDLFGDADDDPFGDDFPRNRLRHVQPGDPANLDYRPPAGDMDSQELAALTSFVKDLPRPVEKDQVDFMRVHRGESLFNRIGCADCHVADVKPVSNVFSDLLLHDMGERLQAASPSPIGAHASGAPFAGRGQGRNRQKQYPVQGPFSGEEISTSSYGGGSFGGFVPIAEAIERPAQPRFPRGERPEKTNGTATWDDLQREWRTPPLWGVADSAPYLHDGRAETLTEAILWHGGEAKSSRDQFESLAMEKRVLLLDFLGSLRAPPIPKSMKPKRKPATVASAR